MPAIDEKTLKQHIKDKALLKVYLIYGNEDFLKKYYAGLICDTAVPDPLKSMNFTRFDGGNFKIEDFSDAVEVLPFGGDRRCILAVDLDVNSLSKDEEEGLLELIDGLPDSCVLVFWQNLVEVDIKASTKWKKFLAAVQKAGCSVKLDKRDVDSLIRLLVKWANSRGCLLSRENARFLVELCGDDIANLQNELEKLCAFTGQGEITREVIEKVGVKSLSASVFDMSRALIRRDFEKAFLLLDDLMALKQEPVSVLAVLSSAFVDMYRGKSAAIAGVGVDRLVKEFGYTGKEFRIRNALRDSAGISLEQLRACLDILLKADSKLKSSRVEGRVILEQALGELVLLFAGKAAAHDKN